jgi:hypothetical protein
VAVKKRTEANGRCWCERSSNELEGSYARRSVLHSALLSHGFRVCNSVMLAALVTVVQRGAQKYKRFSCCPGKVGSSTQLGRC